MKVLITGSEGFIASHLRKLIEESTDWEYESYDWNYISNQDICSQGDLEVYAEGCDLIFNLAGEIRVPPSFNDPIRYWRNNTLGAATVFKVARELGIPVVQASTAAASMPESSPYAASKRAAEMAADIENKLGADIRIVRIFNVYGPGQPDDFVIPLFVKSDKIVLHNKGEIQKDYIHVRDVAKGLLAASEERRDFFKVGSGKLTSAAFIAKICKAFRLNKPEITSAENIQRLNDHQGEVASSMWPSNWYPEICIEEGIAEMVRMHESK